MTSISSIPAPQVESSYTLMKLQITHLPQMLALQDAILDDLAKDQQDSFIVKKTDEDFKRFLTTPHYAIGIFSNGQLVAQTMIGHVKPKDTPVNLTPCDGINAHLARHKTHYATIGGVLTHPAHRGKGLMKKMVKSAVNILQAHQIDPIYAEVAVGNKPSELGFLHNGFEIVAHDVDPADGTPLAFVYYTSKGYVR